MQTPLNHIFYISLFLPIVIIEVIFTYRLDVGYSYCRIKFSYPYPYPGPRNTERLAQEHSGQVQGGMYITTGQEEEVDVHHQPKKLQGENSTTSGRNDQVS